mgnify:CR=1 FL=1
MVQWRCGVECMGMLVSVIRGLGQGKDRKRRQWEVTWNRQIGMWVEGSWGEKRGLVSCVGVSL